MSDSVRRVTETQVRREMLRTEDRDYRRRVRIGILIALVTAFVLGALAEHFWFVLADIRSDGMSDTVRIGDVALCVRADAPMLTRPIERGSLALVRYTESGLVHQALRRVIATAGDEVALDEVGRVTLNGTALTEPYVTLRDEAEALGHEVVPGGALENPFATAQVAVDQPEDRTEALVDDMDYPLVVPDGMLFVLCDNRGNLLDSRSSRFGLVKEADVVGQAQAVVWPIYRATWLSEHGA